MIGWIQPVLLPLATFILALALSIIPLGEAVAPFRPDWVPLVLIYWAIARPRHVGLLAAFAMGLALDMLTGSLLGKHALALLPVVYLALRLRLRIRVALAWQVTVTVALLLVLYHFLLFWIDGVGQRAIPGPTAWAPILSSALLWPAVMFALGGFGRDDVKAT